MKEDDNNAKYKYNNVKPKKWYQKIIKSKIDYTQLLDRTIFSNVPDQNINNNQIETAKYNYFSFVPLNLVQQFSKMANVYFLFIAILQTIPVISLSEGRPTIAIPLVFVVTISMIKDFVQDFKRRQNDIKQNESQVQVLGNIGFSIRKWQQLRVGDIIRLKKDEYFPCDVILLDYPKQHKTAFIETKNLDGQTNLKLKTVSQKLQMIRQLNQLDLYTIQLQFSYEKPNPFLTTFNGNVKIQNHKFLIDNSNVILRGCSLKINQWVIGMCVYTGHQTKILLNSGEKHTKTSSAEKYLNQYFKYIFVFQMIVTLASSIAFAALYSININNVGYVALSGSIVANMFFTWGSWFISFSNFIPISLLVTVQMVRFGQGKLLNKDQLCKSKGQYVQVQTSNINEELGQISYVLSDKTGTLTQNVMQFKCLYVNGENYGEYQVKEQIPLQIGQIGQNIYNQSQNLSQNLKKFTQLKDSLKQIQNVDFSKQQRQRLIIQMQSNQYSSQKIKQVLLLLSLCHNVVVQKGGYTSSSPDELAFVNFAKYVGFQFIQKNDNNQFQILQKIGQEQKRLKYKLLNVLDFSSDRKRMSVIVQDLNQEQSKILLLIKGADEVILSRMIKYQSEEKGKQILEEYQTILFNYACKGLRTLLLANKEVDVQYYLDWNQRYNNALTTIGAERYEMIDAIQSEIQKDLNIIGATAIEDKLQDSVKETIVDLKKSNIKVWMLTGDKKETAISIGYSCGLIDKNSQKITLDCDHQSAKQLLLNLKSMIHILNNKKVTIFSGEFIKRIDQETMQHLQDILRQSQCVICCRVSPKDKEQITKIVRKWGITLAIGDGANDVNMINSANIGIGVRGIEGSQATRAADYIITEFKHLKRLILFHGINLYHRNSNVMLYTLYRNMLVTLPNLLYGPLSMQSATYIYDIYTVQLFNVFYCSFPIVFYGLFDTLYTWKQIKQNPQHYNQGQTNKYFNRKILVQQIIQTIVYSTILVYIVYYGTQLQLNGRGLMIYQQWSGNLILAIVIFSCNIRSIVISNQFSIFQGCLVLLGIFIYYISYFLIGVAFGNDAKGTLNHQFSTGTYWLLIFLFCFMIEGFQVFKIVMRNMNRVMMIGDKKMKNQQRIVKEIQLGNIENSNKIHQISLQQDSMIEKNEIGGYAFAQDENRMKLATEFQSVSINSKKHLHQL